MKTLNSVGAVALFALGSFVLISFKTLESPKTDDLVKDWERAKTYTKEYLDAMPEDGYGFKPTEEMRSFSEQMLHLAEANYGLSSAATGKKAPYSFGQLEKANAKSKDEVSKLVMDSYDFVLASIKEADDSKLSSMVKIFNFDMTSEKAFSKTFEHQTHHRGQTTVYLRLKGVKPPQEKLF
jgi:uncharacterized damage-inducible protein DinB